MKSFHYLHKQWMLIYNQHSVCCKEYLLYSHSYNKKATKYISWQKSLCVAGFIRANLQSIQNWHSFPNHIHCCCFCSWACLLNWGEQNEYTTIYCEIVIKSQFFHQFSICTFGYKLFTLQLKLLGEFNP